MRTDLQRSTPVLHKRRKKRQAGIGDVGPSLPVRISFNFEPSNISILPPPNLRLTPRHSIESD
jgi:hypothetical protein